METKFLIEYALEEQAKMENLLMSLKKYDPSNNFKIKTKKEVLKMQKICLKQEIKLLGHLNLGWMYRPRNELENVIKNIKSDIDLNVIID